MGCGLLIVHHGSVRFRRISQTLNRQSYTLLGFRPCFRGLFHENTPFSTPILQGFPLGVANTPLNGVRRLVALGSCPHWLLLKANRSSRAQLRHAVNYSCT